MSLLHSSDSLASNPASSFSSASTNPVPVSREFHPETQPVDRRGRGSHAQRRGGAERRQFGSSHADLSPDGRELAAAIDAYKIDHHRRYITCDEMLVVLSALGYTKPTAAG